jgi:hypothetical protein
MICKVFFYFHSSQSPGFENDVVVLRVMEPYPMGIWTLGWP